VTGGTAAASATAAAAASLPEEVMGCKELARALLTITDQAKRFDVWRRFGVHVYRMPPPAAPGMGYYRHLLDSVAPKRHSVPLVLHAMLEQASDILCQDRLAPCLIGSLSRLAQVIYACEVLCGHEEGFCCPWQLGPQATVTSKYLHVEIQRSKHISCARACARHA
jgi:hypothetical protein